MTILGTSVDSIDLAEDRGRFSGLLTTLGLKGPAFATADGARGGAGEGRRRWLPAAGPPVLRARRPGDGDLLLEGRARRLPAPHRRARRATEIYLDRFLENAIEIDVDALADGETVHIGAIMQHVEEAGVHSGDSACVIPAMSLGPEMTRQVEEATERLALGLGVVGLINIQFAVHGDDLYVIEANPRASRTVPFVSKAVGIPLAKFACRVMLGERLADMADELDGYGDGEHVSVKEAVLPFGRFPHADSVLGPEMKSTGEVMGVANDFPAAFGKAQSAAGARLPDRGTVFISVTDGDKPAATGLAAALHDMGFDILATGGTASAIRRMGVPVERILEARPRARPTWSTGSTAGEVDIVINTPTGSGARADGWEIRRAAVARGIPCITTMTGASAAQRAIQARRNGEPPVRSLQELHGTEDAPRDRLRSAAGSGTRRSRVEAARRLRADLASPTTPASRPAAGAVLHAAPPSRAGAREPDERPYLPRAFSHARVARRRVARLPAGGDRAGHGAAGGARGGGGGLADRPARHRLRARAGRRRCSSAAASAPRRCCAFRTSSARTRRSCSASARRRTRRRRASSPRAAWRSPPTTARSATRGFVTELMSGRLGDVEVFSCGPPPMLEAIRAHLRRARRAGPAGARVGDGLRLRRLLRLRRPDARTATSACASTARCSRRDELETALIRDGEP